MSSIDHSGVKGMKWGVRKDQGHMGQRARTSKIARLDRKFEKQASKPMFQLMDVHNKAVPKANIDIQRINAKYKGVDLTKDPVKQKRYDAEVSKAYMRRINEQVSSMGTNASGTKKYSVVDGAYDTWVLDVVDVAHSDESFKLKITRNELGHIISVRPVESDISHSGVKGMKWGVRKGPQKGATSVGVKVGATLAGGPLGIGAALAVDARRAKQTRVESAKSVVTKTNKNFAKDAQAKALVRTTRDISEINKRYRMRNLKSNPAAKARYEAEIKSAHLKNLNSATKDLKFDIKSRDDGSWDVTSNSVQHADTPSTHVILKRDTDGLVIGFEVDDSQSISHSGVKGMKWGKRKGLTVSTSVTKKAKVDTSSPEAKAVAQIRTKKAKELTNAELKTAITRLQLERQYRDLNPTRVQAGMKAVNKTILGPVGKQVIGATMGPVAKAASSAVSRGIEANLGR